MTIDLARNPRFSQVPFYHWYEMSHAAFAPLRAVADATKLYYDNPLNPLSHSAFGKNVSAACELFERTTRRYGKPVFGLETTEIDGIEVPVREKTVWSRPFCNLVHFQRPNPTRRKTSAPEPKLLIVAPMSGHYATLLRGTVETMLPYYDVYVTDWIDARAVPMSEGGFDLDDYIDYLIQIFGHLGKGAHVMAVCQPSVPVLAAAALMDEADHPALPASMVLMGGPIDTRINPTAVNKMAEEKDLEWFETNAVMKVPFPHPGFMRPVYPGFLQLTGFMSMNLDRHLDAHKEFFNHLVEGDGDSADKHTDFYDEYMAVMDLTAEFYLQTVDAVFIRHALPKGEFTYRGHLVDPSAIHRIALMTVEGENDDISGVGQTQAAHRVCTNLPEDMRAHYMQPKVGHYGVFNGSRFRSEIAPRIRDFTATHSERLSAVNAAPAPVAKQPAKAVATAPVKKQPSAGAEQTIAAKTRKSRRKKPALAKARNDLASLLLSKPQGAADDLKKISGLGPKLENTLNQIGIFHFAQIARLSRKAITELDEKLTFKGRIARDKWVEQAKKLTDMPAKDASLG
uniref:polyhydroxyalkanoate depolymerase n=1 Tax=Pararhizobium sp. IMCC3301 TaxID=3067904 RepID=UPI002740E63B|nr:polyhydroxyalkanoate depolymerase [Pararhizobium sp. IMCC3301]